MPLQSIPLPGLFGGVSQQIPALRHPTQCTEQTNAIATLVDGLYKRPGAAHIALLPLTSGGLSVSGSNGAAYAHVIDKGDAGRYQLVLVNGSLMLYDMASGAAQTVTTPNGTAYLNTSSPETDFRCVTVADYTFIINRSKVPAMQAATSTANPATVTYINVRTAVPNITYKVVVDAIPFTLDTDNTPTCGGIAENFRGQIAAGMPGYTATVIPGTNVIKVTKPSGTLVASVSDGWGNNALLEFSQGVDLYSDLPPVFETGYVITVRGSASSQADPYYVKWNGKRWEETFKPTATEAIDPATMPHQLRKTVSGWAFEGATWENRKVGDDNTVPLPSFIGKPIRNVLFHRNRLGFLAGDSLVMSRAGAYFGFFATTATQALDTDPIDLSATSKDVDTLECSVEYNDTLLVFSSTKQQFRLVADQVLSPSTARLLPATAFEFYPRATPVAVGNHVFFGANAGEGFQVNLYRVSTDTVTSTAEDLTEHCPSYVPKNPRMLAVSTTFKALAVVPSGLSKEIHLFKYETDGEKLQQKAWGKVVFETPDTCRIMCVHWASRKLLVLAHTAAALDGTAGGRFHLWSIDFERTAKDTNAGFSLRLDQKVQVTGGTFDGTNTRVDVPYIGTDLVYVKCVGGSEPVELVPVQRTVVGTTTQALIAGNHTGATFWVGRRFTLRYVFSEFFLRDGNGQPIQAAVSRVIRLLMRYVKTGYFKATVQHLLRGTYTYPFSGHTVGLPGQGATQLALSDGEFSIPVMGKPEGCVVAVESDSILPVNVPYAEWTGDITLKAYRK